MIQGQWFKLNNNLNNCDTKLIFNLIYYFFKLIININNFELTINFKLILIIAYLIQFCLSNKYVMVHV